jgi:hypothetical protein
MQASFPQQDCKREPYCKKTVDYPKPAQDQRQSRRSFLGCLHRHRGEPRHDRHRLGRQARTGPRAGEPVVSHSAFRAGLFSKPAAARLTPGAAHRDGVRASRPKGGGRSTCFSGRGAGRQRAGLNCGPPGASSTLPLEVARDLQRTPIDEPQPRLLVSRKHTLH